MILASAAIFFYNVFVFVGLYVASFDKAVTVRFVPAIGSYDLSKKMTLRILLLIDVLLGIVLLTHISNVLSVLLRKIKSNVKYYV